MSAQTVDLPAPFGSAWAREPWAAYAQLRAEGGITRIHVRPGLEPWLVTDHSLVRTVLSDPRFSTDPASTTQEVRDAIMAGEPEEKVALLGRNLLAVDPPDHTRMRRLVSGALSARRMSELESSVVGIADRLLDRLSERDTIDLLADYAVPLAVAVDCSLLGLPADVHDQFIAWGQAMIRAELRDAEDFDRVSQEMESYFVPYILSRRSAPGDDLVSYLATARNEDHLDDYELISLVYQLFFAGHESSAYFLASSVLVLLQHPGELERIRTDPDALGAAVEELLRLEGPVKVPTWRFPTEPLSLGGTDLSPGEPVLALISAANRDESVYPDPDAFRPDRNNQTHHFAFGHGIHHCLGAALGRMQARVGIGRLVAHYPRLELATPVDTLPWRVNLMTRGVSELPVRLRRLE